MPKTAILNAEAIKTVAFVSLGCPKNLVDSEKMLGLLAEDGLIPIADEHDADAIVINTCGFLAAAKDESIDEIRRAAQFKAAGSCKRLIVAGCLVQRHRAKLLEWCPQIDAVIGVFDRDRIVEAVRGTRPQRDAPGAAEAVYSSIAATAIDAGQARGINAKGYFESDATRLRLTPRHYAYLRIAEGCNQTCSFCTIPSIRGPLRSKPVETICAEARELLDDGAFELNLIGQDTTSYGRDIGYKAGLVGMLEALNDTVAQGPGGAGWLRLMYAYPTRFTDEIIDAIARLSHVVKYVDMPLQHINDRILKAMRRGTTRKRIEALLDKLRTRVPGIALRTTLISGFPGETQAEHEELVAFVRAVGFDALGVFAYSSEPGTAAAELDRAGLSIADELVAERVEELMLTQQQVAFSRNQALAERGMELDVLIDAVDDDVATGRGYHQAPQIDGIVRVKSAEPVVPGELIRCRVIEADGYDLVAQPIATAQANPYLSIKGYA
jgi:ribosomal protein S12 methylthiotransferase